MMPTCPLARTLHSLMSLAHSLYPLVLNVFIDIQTSKELTQMDIDKMMTYETFTMDDEKLTPVIIEHNRIGSFCFICLQMIPFCLFAFK